MNRVRALGASLMLIFGVGCAGASGQSPHSAFERKAQSVHERHSQRARFDPHTQIRITHWHRDLRYLEGEWAKSRPKAERDIILARLHRWEQQSQDKERFVILIDVRDADEQGQDPRLDLSRWTFGLRQGTRSLDATNIQILSKARYPATLGRAHWRIGAQVDFPRPPSADPIVLAVLPPDEGVPKWGLRTLLPQLPARFEFTADPKSVPRVARSKSGPSRDSLTVDPATK